MKDSEQKKRLQWYYQMETPKYKLKEESTQPGYCQISFYYYLVLEPHLTVEEREGQKEGRMGGREERRKERKKQGSKEGKKGRRREKER